MERDSLSMRKGRPFQYYEAMQLQVINHTSDFICEVFRVNFTRLCIHSPLCGGDLNVDSDEYIESPYAKTVFWF